MVSGDAWYWSEPDLRAVQPTLEEVATRIYGARPACRVDTQRGLAQRCDARISQLGPGVDDKRACEQVIARQWWPG